MFYSNVRDYPRVTAVAVCKRMNVRQPIVESKQRFVQSHYGGPTNESWLRLQAVSPLRKNKSLTGAFETSLPRLRTQKHESLAAAKCTSQMELAKPGISLLRSYLQPLLLLPDWLQIQASTGRGELPQRSGIPPGQKK